MNNHVIWSSTSLMSMLGHGLAPSLHANLVLKGGAAMALAFKSIRVTGDVDFTSMVEPAYLAEKLAPELNDLLPKTAITLGYLDLLCQVQSVKKMPRAENFEDHAFPALRVRIGSAKRGTAEATKLVEGKASRVLDVEISFRDHVYNFQELNLIGAGVAVRAFTIHELVAEKFRALLQQPVRKRNRRQDEVPWTSQKSSNAPRLSGTRSHWRSATCPRLKPVSPLCATSTRPCLGDGRCCGRQARGITAIFPVCVIRPSHPKRSPTSVKVYSFAMIPSSMASFEVRWSYSA